MDDDLNQLNACLDLLCLAKFESFPAHLVTHVQVGRWIAVADLCRELGLPDQEFKPELFVSWLSDPQGDERYVVILYYDAETNGTTAGHFNRGRIAASTASNSSEEPHVRAVVPVERVA